MNIAHHASLRGRRAISLWGLLLCLALPAWPQFSACDLNQDTLTNVVDVNRSVGMVLGTTACTANVEGPGACSIVTVQRVVNASLGQACVTYNGSNATLSTLSCQLTALTSSQNTSCTITLAQPASGASTVTLSKNVGGGLTIPSSVIVSSGLTSATFTASAGSAITVNETATITASLNGVTRSTNINLVAPTAQLSSMSCAPASLNAGQSATCSVGLTTAVASPTTVALSHNAGAALTLPASVSVSAGSTTASFTATAAATLSASQTATVTASLAGNSTTTQIGLVAVVAPAPYKVTLTWTASPTSGVTGYNLYRTTNLVTPTWSKVNASPVTGPTFVDATVLNGTTYHYVATAIGPAGESGYSGVSTAAIPVL